MIIPFEQMQIYFFRAFIFSSETEVSYCLISGAYYEFHFSPDIVYFGDAGAGISESLGQLFR